MDGLVKLEKIERVVCAELAEVKSTKAKTAHTPVQARTQSFMRNEPPKQSQNS
jgi:hypothetical protein